MQGIACVYLRPRHRRAHRAVRVLHDRKLDSPAEWRIGRWPEPDGSCRCRPSQKHNAHGPEFVKIHYQFHPLFGQSLRVQRRAKFPHGEYIFCEFPDGTIGGFPSWIADVSKASAITVGTSVVSVSALTELHTLLSGLLSDFKRAKASEETVLKERTNEAKRTVLDDADEPAVL
jgi:hypothetical protein